MTLRIGALGSTRGTALQGVIDAIAAGSLDAKIVLIVSDKAEAGILERARLAGIPARHLSAGGLTRQTFDVGVSQAFRDADAEIIVMTGYMRIVSDAFVETWRGRLLNVHPSLLPAFAGGMNMDVHRAVLESGVAETGCTIHLVTEQVDGGPVLVQKRCAILPAIRRKR